MSALRCGLCGRNNYYLTKTPCCNNWICDDEHLHGLIPFYSSCSRNHERYTLCSHHYVEGHKGKDWRKCNKCKGDFLPEDFTWYSTNQSNFSQRLPKNQRISCAKCHKVIDVDEDAHIRSGEGYYCMSCMMKPPADKKAKSKAQTSTKSSNPPRSLSSGNESAQTTAPKITSKTLDESIKDELKFKFGGKDKVLVEHEKIEKAAQEKRGRKEGTSKRTMSSSSAQAKSKSQQRKVQNSKTNRTMKKSLAIRATPQTNKVGSSKSASRKYGKRKASVDFESNKPSKKVKKNSQLNSGKDIELRVEDHVNISSTLDPQKRSASKTGRENSRNKKSAERSSSGGKAKEKKKVQWTTKKTWLPPGWY